MIVRGRAANPPLRLKLRHDSSIWPVARPRTAAIRTNCGRRGFASRREHGPGQGHACLANLVQGTVCKILDQEDVKPHKYATIWGAAAPTSRKMAEMLSFIARWGRSTPGARQPRRTTVRLGRAHRSSRRRTRLAGFRSCSASRKRWTGKTPRELRGAELALG